MEVFDGRGVILSIGPAGAIGTDCGCMFRRGREFVVVFPSVEQAADTLYVGTYSGRDVDKFAETKLANATATRANPQA